MAFPLAVTARMAAAVGFIFPYSSARVSPFLNIFKFSVRLDFAYFWSLINSVAGTPLCRFCRLIAPSFFFFFFYGEQFFFALRVLSTTLEDICQLFTSTAVCSFKHSLS